MLAFLGVDQAPCSLSPPHPLPLGKYGPRVRMGSTHWQRGMYFTEGSSVDRKHPALGQGVGVAKCTPYDQRGLDIFHPWIALGRFFPPSAWLPSAPQPEGPHHGRVSDPCPSGLARETSELPWSLLSVNLFHLKCAFNVNHIKSF